MVFEDPKPSESPQSTVIGMIASVNTPIPENGVGEIAYVQSSTLRPGQARPKAMWQSPRASRSG